jgi:hypothetical protein
VSGTPPVREDGLCACGCGRTLPRSPGARRYAGAFLDLDPFATARCARTYFGTLPPETPAQRSAREAASASGHVASFRLKPRSIPGTKGERVR